MENDLKYLNTAELVEYFRSDRRQVIDDWNLDGWYIQRENRRLKESVRQTVESMVGLRTTAWGMRQHAKWQNQCELYRTLIRKNPNSEFVAEWKDSIRRTLRAMRSQRFIASFYTPAMSASPFYFEPNTLFVPYHPGDLAMGTRCELEEAKKAGVTFAHVFETEMTMRDFYAYLRPLQRQRATGFWTAAFNVDDIDLTNRVGETAKSVFMFENAADLNELVKIRLAHGETFDA